MISNMNFNIIANGESRNSPEKITLFKYFLIELTNIRQYQSNVKLHEVFEYIVRAYDEGKLLKDDLIAEIGWLQKTRPMGVP